MSNTELEDIQKQVWQASIANADNPLGYRILDAHFAQLLQLILDEVIGNNQNEYLTPPMRTGESGEGFIDGTPNQLAIQNNRLRADQRQRAITLFGGKE